MSKIAYKSITSSIPVDPEEWYLLQNPQANQSAADRFPDLASQTFAIGAVKIYSVAYYFTFDHLRRLLFKRMDQQLIFNPVLVASKLAGVNESSINHMQIRHVISTTGSSASSLNVAPITTDTPPNSNLGFQLVSDEKKAYYDARMQMKSKGVYIPAKGSPYEIECHVDDVSRLLNCDGPFESAGQSSCPNLEVFGYKLCMFSNCSGPVNKLATVIEQRQTVEGRQRFDVERFRCNPDFL
jgi:hypothetical protein